ncbi:MAG: hypothetical protein ACPGU6_04355 [Tenacibaculum sp.]
MSKYYKEKHLQATVYKIENVLRQQNFILKHKWKVFFVGVIFSFWAPTHNSVAPFNQRRDSLVEKGELSYWNLVLMCGAIYIIFCLLYHLSSVYQDKKKLKKLTELRIKLEKEISDLN